MSAIVAAAQRLEDRRIDAVLGRAFTRGDELRAMIIAAGRAIVDASNAACRAMVRGAPSTPPLGVEHRRPRPAPLRLAATVCERS